MKPKDALRVQESFLSGPEKRFLVGCAKRLPAKILPDHLTWLGFAGALVTGLAYVLTNWSKAYLWIASLGFVVNWLGDSLDGTLARVRQIQRPSYGFFIDHNMDALTALVIGVGAGMSPFVSFSVALLLLIGYYLLCIFTYINTYLKEVFKISYGGFGPTELRLALIALNTVFYFGNMEKTPVQLFGFSLSFFDLLALAIVLVLYGLYFYFFLSARKEYEKVDPPKNPP